MRQVNRTTGERLKAEGRQEGRQESIRAGHLEFIEAQLDSKFGSLSVETLSVLRSLPDDQLKKLAIAIPNAQSLADLGLVQPTP